MKRDKKYALDAATVERERKIQEMMQLGNIYLGIINFKKHFSRLILCYYLSTVFCLLYLFSQRQNELISIVLS